MNKVEFLETFLSLYISHHEVLRDMESNEKKYVVIDVRNAPKEVKKDKIKSSIEIPAKDLKNQLSDLSKEKIYVVYDWTGGTTLGKEALLELYKNNYEAYELAGALEGWKGMKLPLENVI
ncbi:sulfurtransferase [Staphylococcus equorum]|uniref:rhodanese-like domain-containing protein n=1 Tax=Staphylococcus equorum TaxID=246432 RepID=UPI000D1CB446|nr:rhodanese-like domain-containing protein [Staphylococcus equorum]PTE80379.1 sulfurtransferase [Staphylococcus equorum]PTE93174.1 sulfurtransferase [Staphylococcus equorum]